jgi:hypothetical protein
MNAAVGQGRQEGPLTELGAVVTEAIAFAESVPEPYRGRVFDIAYERLSNGRPAIRTPVSTAVLVEEPVAVTPIVTGGLAALARELEVEPRALARVISVGDDGQLSIVGRVESRRNGAMQVEYSIVYMLAKERLFNQVDIQSEELRALCRAKSCYNQDHYADYFTASDLLSPVGTGKSRSYRLTPKGVRAAQALLKKLVQV